MERRKFVIGLGSLAAGGAAAMGTGAFSAAQIDGREANIEVSSDENALIQLVPGDEVEGVTDSTVDDRVGYEGGQLYISFDSDEGGNGINPNSIYQVGSIGEQGQNALQNLDSANDGIPGPTTADKILYGEGEGVDKPASEDPAFAVRNASDQDYDMTFGIDADEVPQEEEFTAAMVFRSESTGGTDSAAAAAQPITSNPDGFASSMQVNSGDRVFVSILAVAEDVEPSVEGNDLNAELVIEVGEAQGEVTGA
ncbi:hypothetical protein ACOZ35_09800 [Halorubrum xinjiangense]|uniref:hypothetical protein n=1 Tax=Halorubrum xinjiangense TaxID=261291 RepID=UPI003C7038B1